MQPAILSQACARNTHILINTMPAEYIRLTNEQKDALRARAAASPNESRAQLAAWTMKTFKLRREPTRMTMHRILTQPPAHSARPSAKANRSVASPALERELVAWVRKVESLRLPVITGATICEQASRLRDQLVRSSSCSDALKGLVFSHGWLHRFQQRHGLKCRLLQGEAASADMSAVELGRRALQGLTASYSRTDVFNLDETAFFFTTSPPRSISSHTLAGRKQGKKRITVAIACNADGTTKQPLLFVGASQRPRCFGGATSEELGIEYASTPKAWMNTDLFQSWVYRFDASMRADRRRVLLLLDNASPHRVYGPLSNVTIAMLPPNTTAHLQPADAGIIRQFKSQVRKQQTQHVLQQINHILEHESENTQALNKIYDVDVLTAMMWAQEAWARVSPANIANCWRHTHILSDDVYELIEQVQGMSLS